MDKNSIVTIVQSVLERSPYFYYVFRHARQLGFRIGEHSLLMDLEFDSGKVNFSFLEPLAKAQPQLWVEVEEHALLSLESDHNRILLRIETSERGQVLHPAVERLLLKCFEPTSNRSGTISDREDLIYAALFDFVEPQTLWRSTNGQLAGLRFPEGAEGLDAYVSSGFSNPDTGAPSLVVEGIKLVGFGYEVAVLAAPQDRMIGRELVGWIRYVHETGNHILRGNWLEYEEGVIPGTGLAGFLVVSPSSFPELFPLIDGFCCWHLLLGVTKPELQVAKQAGVETVVSLLLSKGYGDCTAAQRRSVV
jgi:Suppressor of fused protein (SUFU)